MAHVAARPALSAPSKNVRRASPPNFRTSPPYASISVSSGVNTVEIAPTISSAPARPCRASFSDSAVKPETSENSSVPSLTQ